MKKETGNAFAGAEIFDALDDLIFVISPNYIIENLNKRAKDFLGLQQNTIPDGKCYQIIFNKTSPCEFCQRDNIKNCSHSCSVEDPIHLGNRYFKMKMHPICEMNMQPGSYIDFLHDVTDEMEAFKKVKETEEKYRLVAENSSDVITLINQDLQITYASPSVQTLIGFSPEEFIQLGLESVLTPESYQKVRALYATDKTRGKITANYQVIKKDQSSIWVEMAITPLRDKNGNIEGYVSQSRDVSDKKEALDALKISEERYMLVQENAQIRISYFNIDGHVIFMNRTSAEILGGTPEEFAGKHYSEIFPADIVEVYESRFKEILESTTSIDYEDEYYAQQRKYISLTTISKITDTEGSPKGVLVIVKDISKLKEAEEKIKRNEDRLKSLLTISQMDHFSQSEILDHALEEALKFTQSKIGFLYHYNEQKMTFSLNGWSKSVHENCSLHEKITHRQLNGSGLWAEAIRERKPIFINDYKQAQDLQKKMPEGHPDLSNYLSVPIFWNKEIVALVGVANKAEAYNENDIQQVQLLMNTVWKIIVRNETEKELIQAKEKAEESDRLKSSFLSNMSHEIRTPINGIMGFLSLLKHDELDEETKEEFFELIEDNFNHLMTLISDIIDISKLEANQISLIYTDVNLDDLIQEVITLNKTDNSQLKNKKITINAQLSKTGQDGSIANTDKVRLRQILINLLNNAIKFTEEGEITIGYELIDDAIQFCVHDTGIGILPDQQKLIFGHFRQADETLTRRYGGTGLGLSISKRLVKLMGGKIWVESQVNEFSKFYFTIPFRPASNQENSLKFSQKDKPTNWKGKTFLIIEDDDSNFLFLRETLKKTEAHILRSSSCQETLQLLEKNYSIDLVLLDIRLPDGLGTDLIPAIRSRLGQIPIIAQTANAFENDRKEYIENGCDDYISKPINENKFFKIIEERLIDKLSKETDYKPEKTEVFLINK